jgi:hypothetical protein
MNAMLPLLKESKCSNILSDRITMEYVLEKLSKGFPILLPGTTPGTFKVATEAQALLVATELSVFITASQFAITALTDLWEAKEGEYGYGTRGKGEWNINSPCVSLFAGSAEEYLVKSIPAEAVGLGFTRRVNFVYAAKSGRRIPFPMPDGFMCQIDLTDDLKAISNMRGEFRFAEDVKPKFEKYYNESEMSEYDDRATAVYKTSRWVQAIKVAMCLSASRDDSLIITLKDWNKAEQLVNKVVDDTKYVFRAVGTSDLVAASDKVLRFLELRGYASKAEILFYNWQDVTGDDLDRILATFREAGIISERTVGSRTVYYITTGGTTP